MYGIAPPEAPLLPSTLAPGALISDMSQAHPPEYLDSLVSILIDSLIPSCESLGLTRQQLNKAAFGISEFTTFGVASVTECVANCVYLSMTAWMPSLCIR